VRYSLQIFYFGPSDVVGILASVTSNSQGDALMEGDGLRGGGRVACLPCIMSHFLRGIKLIPLFVHRPLLRKKVLQMVPTLNFRTITLGKYFI